MDLSVIAEDISILSHLLVHQRLSAVSLQFNTSARYSPKKVHGQKVFFCIAMKIRQYRHKDKHSVYLAETFLNAK